MAEAARVSDLELIRSAVEMPGEMGPQYTYFRDLSQGNQAYLWMQGARETTGKYIDWPKVGRHVVKGSKAYEIIRPVFRRMGRLALEGVGAEEPEEPKQELAGFVGSRCMFTLSQTEGEEVPPPKIPGWNMLLAMGKLAIHQTAWDSTNGNLQGYSRGLEFAISPIVHNYWKTVFHEWGHIILGHTMPGRHEEYLNHRGVMEAEAEILAMLCMKGAGLLDDETARHSRAYVQHWLGGHEFPESSARQVLKGADAILRAGRLAVPATNADEA